MYSSLLKFFVGGIWLFLGIVLLALGIAVVLMLFLAPFIVPLLGLLLVVFAPFAALGYWVMGRYIGGQSEVSLPVAAPVVASSQRLATQPSVHPGGWSMRIGRVKLGLVEAGVLTGVAILIAAEAAAVLGGLGPVFAVVALGYFLVLGLLYMLYLQVGSSRGQETAAPIEEVQKAAETGVDRQLLKNVDIFREFSHEQIDRVAALGRLLTVSSGERLGIAGEHGDKVFIVVEGMAQLTAKSAIGDVTVRVAGPGESFPLAALIGSGALITSVNAMTDMVIVAIPGEELRALCSEDPEIGMKIYSSIAEVLGNRYGRTLAHLTSNAEKALRETGFFANV